MVVVCVVLSFEVFYVDGVSSWFHNQRRPQFVNVIAQQAIRCGLQSLSIKSSEVLSDKQVLLLYKKKTSAGAI